MTESNSNSNRGKRKTMQVWERDVSEEWSVDIVGGRIEDTTRKARRESKTKKLKRETEKFGVGHGIVVIVVVVDRNGDLQRRMRMSCESDPPARPPWCRLWRMEILGNFMGVQAVCSFFSFSSSSRMASNPEMAYHVCLPPTPPRRPGRKRVLARSINC
ncbi:hypothetical protein CMUS01_02219 [Colletotrichum musicola]|uniref:Uncharacterized protein n=1 Tax=Colletotrichum musicola TaxID=2175873 RepID=A0A8H6NVK3_9PEZI|nr:hypothetical protein CMUS01_02219 [Colletotrichum musicola]